MVAMQSSLTLTDWEKSFASSSNCHVTSTLTFDAHKVYAVTEVVEFITITLIVSIKLIKADYYQLASFCILPEIQLKNPRNVKE